MHEDYRLVFRRCDATSISGRQHTHCFRSCGKSPGCFGVWLRQPTNLGYLCLLGANLALAPMSSSWNSWNRKCLSIPRRARPGTFGHMPVQTSRLPSRQFIMGKPPALPGDSQRLTFPGGSSRDSCRLILGDMQHNARGRSAWHRHRGCVWLCFISRVCGAMVQPGVSARCFMPL